MTLKKLSFVLNHVPTEMQGNRLQLVGVDITIIDPLPLLLATRVEVLYLSNNNISSCDGLLQFSNLHCLSLANNNFRYLYQIYALSHSNLLKLEKLSFEGNIISEMPYYRAYVLGLCPHLQSLDGLRVTPAERLNAKASARKVSSVFEQLRNNEVQNVVLRHLHLLASCHSELLRIVMGGPTRRTLRRGGGSERALLGDSISMAVTGGQMLHGGGGRGSVGRVLRQAIAGGVFRWLLHACAQDIDTTVQVVAHPYNPFFLFILLPSFLPFPTLFQNKIKFSFYYLFSIKFRI